MGSQTPQAISNPNSDKYSMLSKQIQGSYVSNTQSSHQIAADWYRQPKDRHYQQFKEASHTVDNEKLYLDDEQIKIHKAHSDRILKTRKEITSQIKNLSQTKDGMKQVNETLKLERKYLEEVRKANVELEQKLKACNNSFFAKQIAKIQ